MTSEELPESVRVQYEETKSLQQLVQDDLAGIIVVTDSETGITLNLDDAFESGLIDQEKFHELKEKEKSGIRELEVSQIDGKVFVFSAQSGETFTVEEAITRGFISLPVYERLRKSQETARQETRSQQLPRSVTITDPKTNKQYTIEEAVTRKLISQQGYNDIITRFSSMNAPLNKQSMPNLNKNEVLIPSNRNSYVSNVDLSHLHEIHISHFKTSIEILHREFRAHFEEIDVNEVLESLPNVFNFETQEFERNATVQNLTESKIPGACIIADQNSDLKLSLDEAVGQGIVSVEDKNSLVNSQISKVRKFVKNYLNDIIVISEQLPNDAKTVSFKNAISELSMNAVQVNEITEKLFNIVNEIRFDSILRNQRFFIHNTKSANLFVTLLQF